MSNELVAGLIEGVNELIERIGLSPDILAEELLDETLYTYPAPAWNTGELRSSGAAYVGGRFVSQTPWVGSNPEGWFEKFGKRGSAGEGGGFFGRTGGNVYSGMRKQYLSSSVRDTISIVYHSPVAEMMHEWSGGFTADDAGPGYIEEKLLHSAYNLRNVYRMVFS